MTLLFWAVAAAPLAQGAAPFLSRSEEVGRARAALARQDIAAAIRLLEQADASFPSDAEILRLLGSAYAFDRRYPQAIATLRRAESLAPDDLDIRTALARAYLWSGDRSAAEKEVAAIEQRSPGNADATALRQQFRDSAEGAGDGRRSWELAANQTFSDVSFPARPSQIWSNSSLTLFGRLGEGTAISLGGEREDRRTAVDTRIEMRLDQQLSPKVRAFVAVATTPNADFREKWGVTGGLEADITSFATLLADLRHAEYRDASVTVFQPGIRLSARKAGLDATVRMLNLWDEDGAHRAGISGRIDRTSSSGAVLYAGAATYPDTEAGITRQVHSFFGGAVIPVSQPVSFRAGLDYDRRRATYTRKGASLGVQVRF